MMGVVEVFPRVAAWWPLNFPSQVLQYGVGDESAASWPFASVDAGSSLSVTSIDASIQRAKKAFAS